jgi:hypothetical protein
MKYCFAAVVRLSECLLRKCMKPDHAVLSFTRASFGNGGSKDGSFIEGVDNGDVRLRARPGNGKPSPPRAEVAWSDASGVSTPVAEVCPSAALGDSGAGRKRLPIPLAITPGWIPKNGVSKFIVPKIRW